MNKPQLEERQEPACEIIDFDSALLDACSPQVRADLLLEARIVAHAFADEGSADELERIAAELNAGGRDDEMDRAHARKLAAALKRLAVEPWS